MWVAGVDGCPGGWLAAYVPLDGGEIRLRVESSFAGVVDAPETPAIIAVDMPIGLPNCIVGPGRAPEQAVRPLLGARQSSVFSMPARLAVETRDYVEACALALAASDPPRKISRQGFMLFPKIREIDLLLRERPSDRARVYEVHPEVSFWRMNGDAPLALPKKVKSRAHDPGLALRRRLLEAAGIDAAAIDRPVPRGAARDDQLDALACLVTARRIARGEATPFPDPPERDEHGLPVAIWA